MGIAISHYHLVQHLDRNHNFLLSLHTDPQNTRKKKMQPKSTVMVCASQPHAGVAGHHSHFGVGRRL